MSRSYKIRRDYKRSYARTMGRRDAHRHSNRIDRKNAWIRTLARQYLFTGKGFLTVAVSLLIPASGAYMLYQSAGMGNIFESGALIFFISGVPLTFIGLHAIFGLLRLFMAMLLFFSA